MFCFLLEGEDSGGREFISTVTARKAKARNMPTLDNIEDDDENEIVVDKCSDELLLDEQEYDELVV